MPTTPAKSPSIIARILRVPPVDPPGRLLDEPRYRALRSEIDRAQEVSGEATDWTQVEHLGLGLLGDGFDDLLVAAYTARGAQERDLLEGVELGLALFTEFLGARWTSATPAPKRLRARTSALRWWVRAATELLRNATGGGSLGSAGDPNALSEERLGRLDASLQHLAALTRQRAGDDAPSLAGLRRELRRHRPPAAPTAIGSPAGRGQDTPHTHTSKAPRAPKRGDTSDTQAIREDSGEADPSTRSGNADPVRRDAPPPEPPVDRIPDTAADPAAQAPLPEPEKGASQRDLERQVRRLGERLIETGERLRSLDPRDPRSYDLLRHGLWLHLQALPPSVAGKTKLVETSPSALRQLEALRGRARWHEVLDLAERLVIRHRLDLNLQRTTAEALHHLTPPAEEAAASVRRRTLEYVARFPGALDLRNREGAPLADDQTRAWLRSTSPAQVSPLAPSPTQRLPASPGSSPQNAPGRERTPTRSAPEGSDEGRFLYGLGLAERALQDGHRPLANALFAGLVETVEHHHLDRWRPDLAHRARAGALLSQSTPLDPASSAVRRLAALAPGVVARIFANAR